MALCGAGTVLAVALAARRLGLGVVPPLLVALSPLAIGSVILTRFDLWPVMLAAFALAALVAERLRLGHALLGAAVAAKLFPAVLLPLTVAFVWRRRGRREALVCAAVCAAVVLAVFVPFLLVAPGGVLDSFGRQLSRPLQIESLGARSAARRARRVRARARDALEPRVAEPRRRAPGHARGAELDRAGRGARVAVGALRARARALAGASWRSRPPPC